MRPGKPGTKSLSPSPVKAGFALCDYMTGIMNALATMIALYYRDIHKDGKGYSLNYPLPLAGCIAVFQP